MRGVCRGVAQPGSAPALGAGGPEFKSRRPDQNISRIFFSFWKAFFTPNRPVEFRQTGGLKSQVLWFPRVRGMTNSQKHGEAGVLLGNNMK
jgi:hypothetical protein